VLTLVIRPITITLDLPAGESIAVQDGTCILAEADRPAGWPTPVINHLKAPPMPLPSPTRRACLCGGIFSILLVPFIVTPVLIKQDFTPVHLANQAKVIAVVELAAPVGDRVAATPLRTLKGTAPAAAGLSLTALDEEERGWLHAGPALWLGGDFGLGRGTTDEAAPMAVLYLGAEHYLAVHPVDGDLELRSDPYDLSAVWAGGSDLLERLFAQILADPATDVPVNAGATWGGDQRLGTVTGTPIAGRSLELPGIGPCLHLTASGGDQIFCATGNATGAAGITGTSRLVAAGDPTGDGKADLVCWDGQQLTLLEPAPGAVPSVVADAPSDPRGLACPDLGDGQGGGIVVFTAGAPVMLTRRPPGRQELAPPPASTGAASAGLVADLDGDGRPDLVQACANAVVVWPGLAAGGFGAAVVAGTGQFPSVHTLLAADADADGRLDLLLAGDAPPHRLLLNLGGLRFQDRYDDTGELDYHAPSQGSRTATFWDLNLDGRVDLLLFPPDQGPKVYFNRGFACFGYARELHCDGLQGVLPGVKALADRAPVGGTLDLDGDGQVDLVGVAGDGTVWGLLVKPTIAGRMAVTVALPASVPGPVTVCAQDGNRNLGARSVGHGTPALFGKQTKGPLTLTWTGPDGRERSQRMIVLKTQRVELTP
jgi:hypothetical protein